MLSFNSTYNASILSGDGADRSPEERMANTPLQSQDRSLPTSHWDHHGIDCDYDHDFASLKPRRQSLYPSKESLAQTLPDLSLNLNGCCISVKSSTDKSITSDSSDRSISTTGCTSSSCVARKPQVALGVATAAAVKQRASKSNRKNLFPATAPAVAECTSADLFAINKAMQDNDEDDNEKSKYMVQKLLREELGLPAVPQRMKGESKESLRNRVKSSTKDLIYQLCLQLDDVQGNVKQENWQMLAQDEINKLDVFSYNEVTASMVCGPCGPAASASSACDDKCMICQDDYQQNDTLRKLRCGHCFHKACVDPWLLQSDLCPVCRKTIDTEAC